MQKKFVTNLALLLFLNFLIKPLWLFGIEVEVQNTVGTDSYGMYYTIFNLTFIFNFLLDLGIQNFNNRNIAQNQQLLAKHFSRLFSLKVALGMVYALLLFGTALLVLRYSAQYMQLLLWLALNQFLASLVLYFRSNLTGLHLFRWDSIISVLDRALMIGVCSLLLWGGLTQEPFRIEWFVYAQTVAYGVTAGVAFLLVFQRSRVFRPRLSWTFSLAIIKQSIPFALLVMMMSLYHRVDGVMIQQLLADGETQAGIYAQAFRLLDAANIIGYLFAGLLLPIFSTMLKRKEPVQDMVALASRLLIAPAMALAAILVTYRQEFMGLLYDDHTGASAPILAVLICGFVPMASAYVFGTLLTANGSLKVLNQLAFAGVLLNIVLNYILIPHWNAFGAAVASLATQLLVALGQLVVVRNVFRFRVNYRLLATMLGLVVSVALTGYGLQYTGWRWEWQAGTLIGTAVALAFAWRILSIRALAMLLKYG